MNNQQMAIALHNIIEGNEKVALAEQEQQRIVDNPPVQSSQLIIREEEVIAAVRYESSLIEADKKLNLEQANRQKAEKDFRNALPNSVLQDMENNGKAVHAFYVNQDVYARKYGPFAA